MSDPQPRVAEKSATYEVLKQLERSAPWPRVPLTKAVDLNPKPERGSLSDELEVSFVPMAAVEAGTGAIDASAVRRYAEVKKGYTYFREGDVLFAKITPCMENGKMVVARQLRNGIGFGSTEFHVLRPREGVDAHYVYHFVSSARFRAEAAHRMTGGVGQKRVPATFLEQSEIPLPPIDEQRRIVAEIEKQFSRLDEAITNVNTAKARLSAYRASVLSAVQKGTLCGLNSEAWPVRPIGEFATKIQYGSSAKTSASEKGIPVLRMGNIENGELVLDDLKYLPINHAEFPELLLKPGDLLFNRTNSPELVGKVAVYRGNPNPCSFASYLIRLRFANEVVPEFVAFVLNSPYGRAWVRSVVTQQVGQANVNGSKLKAFQMPVPPITLQRRLVAEAERQFSLMRETEVQLEAAELRSENLRSKLLANAFGADNDR